MSLRRSHVFLLLILGLVASTATGQTSGNDRLSALIKSKTNGILASSKNGVPLIILGTPQSSIGLPTSKAVSVQALADRSRDYFRDLATDAGFLPTSAELTSAQPVPVNKAINATLKLSYNGIAVRDRKANVTVGLNGNLIAIRNSFPAVEPNITHPVISAEAIAAKILADATISAPVAIEPTLIYVASNDNSSLRLAYEYQVSEADHLWRYTYDAETGALIEKKDLIVYCMDPNHSGEAHAFDGENSGGKGDKVTETVTGQVKADVLWYSPFKPDTTIDMPSVKISINGTAYNADDQGRFLVENVTYPFTLVSNLDSKFFTVRRDDGSNGKVTMTVTSGSPVVHWTDEHALMSERTAYAAAHRVRAYVKSYNPNLLSIDKKIVVNVNVEGGSCNAFYRPDNQSLNFYPKIGNCSNTAEIPDVIYHEYGHHYHNLRYKDQETNPVSGSLGEAIADITSNFLRDDPVIGYGFTGSSSTLRNSKNTKKWPTNVSEDIHLTGTILTGAVWDLRMKIGLERSNELFHKMLQFVPDAPNASEDDEAVRHCFLEVLLAYLMADDDDNNLINGTPNSAAILSSFDAHNIGLPYFIDLDIVQIPDQGQQANSYPVEAHVSYNTAVGEVDRDSVMFYYSVDGGPYVAMALSHNGNNRFVGEIPKLPIGSIVKYYGTAQSTLDGAGILRSPGGAAVGTFLVAYNKLWTNHGDSEEGITYGVDDNAEKGWWIRGEPFGTKFRGTTFQQDTDRSPYNDRCFITGNAQSSDSSDEALMGGKTTLQIKTFDLEGMKEAVFRFWYFHDSRELTSTTKNSFRVMVSINGGTWKNFYTSNENTDGWQNVTLPIFGATETATTAAFRFISTAANGTMVESGVDDIEVLIPQQPGASVNEETASSLSLGVHPNPFRGNGDVTFSYTLPTMTTVQVKLKDVNGATVWESKAELQQEGPHESNIPMEVASGTYWLQLDSGFGTFYKHVSVVK